MKKMTYESKDWEMLGYFGLAEIYKNENKCLLARNGKVCFTYDYNSKVNEIITKRMTDVPVRDNR